MPAWTAYRQQWAKDMRAYQAGTATSGSTSTLVCATWPFLETRIGNDDFYGGGFLLRPAAVAAGDYVRRVPPNTSLATGYAPTTGTFIPDTNWTNSPGTEAFEWHGHGFDPYTTGLELVNQALKRIPLVVTFVLTPSGASYSHDLTANQAWLTRTSDVYQVSSLGENSSQQQTITEAGSPTGGTFLLTFRGGTTSALAYNVSAASMQTALRLLPYLGAVTVTRSGTTTNFVWTITMQDVVGPTPLFTADAALLTGGTSPSITPAELRPMGPWLPLRGLIYKEGDRVLINLRQRFNQGSITGDRLYVTCRKAAYYHCRASSSGVFGDRSGLAAEAHEAEPIAEWVSAQMRVEAWNRFPQAMDDLVEKRRIGNLQVAHEEARRFRHAYFTPPARSFRPLEANVPGGGRIRPGWPGGMQRRVFG